MIPERFSRTSILLGNEATEKLASSSVVVCGVGAVGSFAVEALARLGIGKFFLWDFDSVEESNINRQLCALDSTIGKEKTEVVRSRILDINPNANVQTYGKITPDAANIVASQGDIIVDAIDTISEKINLIFAAEERGVKIVSSMGAARRVDISKIKVADIMKTYGCPVASSIRKALRAGKYKGKCKFSPCYHAAEPGCAVRADEAEGKLHPLRLERYRQILKDCRETWRERYD